MQYSYQQVIFRLLLSGKNFKNRCNVLSVNILQCFNLRGAWKNNFYLSEILKAPNKLGSLRLFCIYNVAYWHT